MSRQTAFCKMGKPSPDTRSVSIIILDFSTCATVRKSFCCLSNQSIVFDPLLQKQGALPLSLPT